MKNSNRRSKDAPLAASQQDAFIECDDFDGVSGESDYFCLFVVCGGVVAVGGCS